jgi:hypothetical protein
MPLGYKEWVKTEAIFGFDINVLINLQHSCLNKCKTGAIGKLAFVYFQDSISKVQVICTHARMHTHTYTKHYFNIKFVNAIIISHYTKVTMLCNNNASVMAIKSKTSVQQPYSYFQFQTQMT